MGIHLTGNNFTQQKEKDFKKECSNYHNVAIQGCKGDNCKFNGKCPIKK